MKLPALALVFSFSLAAKASAGLTWEQKSLSFHPAISATEVIAHFHFQNTGTNAVAIKAVTTSCTCVSAEPSKQSYAPGEKGEIVAKFTVDERAGVDAKEIYVETDEPESWTNLKMEVTIPKLAEMEPDPLYWNPGEELRPKRIRIIPAKGVVMKLIRLTPSDSGNFSAQLTASSRPGEFEVVITPRAGSPAFSGVLRIETDFPKEHPRALIAHVQVAR